MTKGANLHHLNLSKRAVLPSKSAMNVIQYTTADMPDFDPQLNDNQIYDQIKDRFAIVDDVTRKVMDGKFRSTVLCGPPGIGKTTPVQRMMAKEDPDGMRTNIQSGYIRPPFLFRHLYKWREPGSLSVLDDMDTIWGDVTSLNLLKKATDTTPERHLVYGSDYKLEDEETGEPIPKHFEFGGNVMFVTNINFEAAKRSQKLAPHIEAMESRSFIIDLGMRTKRHLLLRIFQVANEEGLFDDFGFDKKDTKEVLQFIAEHYRVMRELSLRTAVKCAQLKTQIGNDWQDMAKITLMRGGI